MNIVAEYDSSVANAPAGYKTAVQAAFNFIDHLIANPITVTLMFSYGEIQGSPLSSGALGESQTNGNIETYSAVVGYLTAAASSGEKQSLAALPATDPTNGGRFWVSDAQAKVFGLGAEPGYIDPVDGYVGLSSTNAFSYDPADRQVAGEFDAVGVLEHEITEAIGRNGYLGQDGSFNGYALWTPLDLFRYSGPGQHQYAVTSSSQVGYFSVDGQHMLLQYNNPTNGGDADDWNSSVVGDSFGYGYQGTTGQISPTDVLEMGAVGYTINDPHSTDFHNDGLSNLLIENSNNGAVDIGEVSGGSVAWAPLGGLGPEWKFVATGDFLGDGLAGFMIENANGAVDVGEVGPDTSAVYTQVASIGPEWTIVGAGNLLGNGKADMLMENANGAVFVGEADPLTSQMAWTQVGALGPEWKFVGVGDYLGLGRQEFLIENTANGAVDVGNIVGGQAQYAQVAALGPEWTFVETGDFLNDGKAQFLIENANGALVAGEVGANNKTTYTQFGGLGPEWKFVGVGDYLGLGYDQFLISNTHNGAVEVGTFSAGKVEYTQVSSLGPEWSFHH